MSKKIYVGNLSFDVTEEQVKELFTKFGTVESIAMITDRDSGRFRGFCFVEMEASAANKAIIALNEKDLNGRTMAVSEARPRKDNGRQNKRSDNKKRKRGKFPDSGGGII